MTCQTTCHCDNSRFFPVCGADDVNYFSPCHAGCSESHGMVGALRLLTLFPCWVYWVSVCGWVGGVEGGSVDVSLCVYCLVYVCVCVCVCVRAHARARAEYHASTLKCLFKYFDKSPVRKEKHTHTHTHARTHARTHTHTHIDTHTHNLNSHRSGVLLTLFGCCMTGATWTLSMSAHVLCTPYNHSAVLQCHFVRSHIGRVHVCLAVTWHLSFWQNDLDLLHATAVT